MLRIILACICITLLSGCAAVLIGGAAAGGYMVAKDERSAGELVSDGAIASSLKARLIADRYVQGTKISVYVYEGVVSLSGDVTSIIAKEQAEAIALDVKGVKQVKNLIRVINASP